MLLYPREENGGNMHALVKIFKPLFVIRGTVSRRWQIAIFFLAILSIIVGYSLMAYDKDNRLLPTWGKLLAGLQNIITDPVTKDHYLWQDTIDSFSRIIPAVGIASLIGIVIGMYMGVYAGAEAFFSRILTFLGNIAPNAIMVMFLIYFGYKFQMYVAVIVFGIFTMIAKTVFEAVKEIGDEEIFSLKSLNASSSEIVWTVLFPQVLPQILSAIQQAFAPAIIYVISAEWVTGSSGFGYRFSMFSRSGRLELTFPYLLYLGAIGVITLAVFNLLTRILCPWYRKETK